MTKKKPPCGYCGEMGMFSPGCPKCGRKKRRTGRDRQLGKVKFGRRATATAGSANDAWTQDVKVMPIEAWIRGPWRVTKVGRTFRVLFWLGDEFAWLVDAYGSTRWWRSAVEAKTHCDHLSTSGFEFRVVKPKEGRRIVKIERVSLAPKVKKPSRRHRSDLPAMVKDAKKTSARAHDALIGDEAPRLAKLEIAPGRLVQICPIPGKEKILHKVGMVEVRVEIMFTPDGELVIETSIEGLVVGTANVADHLQIK